MTFNYIISQHATAVNTQMRCMIVHDKQTNEAIYTAADLLQDVTVSDSIVAPRNLDFGRRFQVLYDKVHVFSDSGSTNTVKKVYKKLNIKLRFDGSTPSIADLTQSSLSLFLISNEPSNTPLITFFVRLRYVDN